MKSEASGLVSGKTWDVYLYILTSNHPVGVREVWKGLNLSTPSLAQYHINKLVELGLIQKDPSGKYVAKSKAQISVLKSFVFVGGKLIPKLFFYGVFVIGLFISYLYYSSFNWEYKDFIILSLTFFSAFGFLSEAYLLMKRLKS